MFSVDLAVASQEHLDNILPVILAALEGIIQVSKATWRYIPCSTALRNWQTHSKYH